MLGIAIINYNKFDKTIDCIDSVFTTVKDIEYKIYLLDNCSQNESFEVLRKKYAENPLVDCFQSEKNLGYARGNNLCIEKALTDGCEHILISNNDIIFADGAISLLYKEICEKDYLIIGPELRNPDGSIQKNIKLNKPSFKKYMMSETYLHNFDKKRKYNGFAQPADFTDVYWISGAVFMADAEKFRQIGFFDPNTFLYFEEYIISEKAKKAGFKIGLEPAAAAYHYHGASTGGNANYFTRIENFKSEIYFHKAYLHAPKSQLRKIRLIRCLEVLFTFTKEHKLHDALKFVKATKTVLRG